MKLSTGVLVAAFGAALLLAAPAVAQTAIVNGGPSAGRGAVLSSLRALDSDLRVCWRGQRPPAVKVALSVGADGSVRRSVARTAGPAAQCAAGVLAVQTLRATRRGYRMVISIPTRRMAAASINSELRQHITTLRSCFRPGAKANISGKVQLRFLIAPNGSLSRASVARTSLSHPRTERCLTRTTDGLRIAAGTVRQPTWYTLALSFDASKAGGGGGNATADPALQPRKRGPLPGSVISSVVRQKMAEFTRCYERIARRMRRKPSGRVVIRFTIRANGTVRNVKVRETTLKHRRVEACLVGVGKTLRFPGQPGRELTKVWYPFSFRSP